MTSSSQGGVALSRPACRTRGSGGSAHLGGGAGWKCWLGQSAADPRQNSRSFHMEHMKTRFRFILQTQPGSTFFNEPVACWWKTGRKWFWFWSQPADKTSTGGVFKDNQRNLCVCGLTCSLQQSACPALNVRVWKLPIKHETSLKRRAEPSRTELCSNTLKL